MARRSFATRRSLEEHRYHPAVLIAVPLCALFLHAYLPHIWQPFGILDLPLIAVLYFAISWRNRIAGTLLGTAVGLLQDLPGNGYIGIHGIAKALLGYAAASIGLKVDVDNTVTRVLMNLAFFLLQSALLFVMQRYLLGETTYAAEPVHEALRAAVNAAVAIPVFLLLDRTRIQEYA